MFSEKIQYNALPGEEFKQRDLSIPSQSTKLVFEIDSQYGEDKTLCLSILQRTFRGAEAVSKILHNFAAKISKGTKGDKWQFQAAVNRNAKVLELELKLSLLTREIQSLQDDRRSLKRKHTRLTNLFPKDARGAPITPWPRVNLAGQFNDDVEEKKVQEQVEKFHAKERELELNDNEQKRVNKELDNVIGELAYYRADLKNERFTEAEESAAREAVEKEAEDQGEDVKGEWKECLEKILKALLNLPSQQTTRRKMEAIATGAIDAPVRGMGSLLEFATELDKAVKFAEWQAKIFLKGDALSETLTRYELAAYANFQKSLKSVEKSWNFIDDEEERPLRKVLTRLRSVSVGQTLPVLAVKVTRVKREEEDDEEDDEEEEDPKPAPKKKKVSKLVEVAVVQTEMPKPDPVVALLEKILANSEKWQGDGDF